MTGNVREWCQDWYDADYFKDPTIPATNPFNTDVIPHDLSRAHLLKHKVIRGGSWVDINAENFLSPNYAYDISLEASHAFLGFRIVLSGNN